VQQVKKLTPAGMQRVLIKLVQMAGGEVEIPVEELEHMNFDQVIVEYSPSKDSFRLRGTRKDDIILPQNKIIRA